MADILRRVACLAIHRTSGGSLRTLLPLQVRTVFSNSGIGIDGFKMSREQHASRYAPSIDVFKKRFVDSIGQADSTILTEDLRNMIMSANSDQEIDTVIQALKKYSSSKQKLTDYHFGSPVMRLLYIHNKTDLAMQLFMDESLKNIFNDSASALVLMNKLIEETRFDDVIKVFEFAAQRGFSTTSGRAYPSDVVMLAIEALYRQNTKESFNKAKELISKVRERDSDINPRTATMTSLLAIQQGEPAFAMEVMGSIRAQTLTTVQNVRAICYADMGRVEEAINVIQLLAEQAPANSDRRRVFPLVMRHIRMAVEKTKDQNLLTRFEELSKSVMKNNRLSTIDLPEFLTQAINRRNIRPGGQQQSGGNLQRMGGNQRNIGYRQPMYQQSNNQRQGMMSGGYNRQNRFGGMGYNNQSGRFGNNNFQRLDSMGSDRRSQNAYVDGNQRNADNDRFPPRNRSSSFNQSSSRFNRTDSGFSSQSPRNRDRDSNDGNMFNKRMGNRMGSMTTEGHEPVDTPWTNADNAETTRMERRDKGQQSKRTRSSNVTDENATRRDKSNEGSTSGTGGDADPWERSSQPPSSTS